MGTSELTKLEASDPRATELDAAAIKCTDATEGLLACARVSRHYISIRTFYSRKTSTAFNFKQIQSLLYLSNYTQSIINHPLTLNLVIHFSTLSNLSVYLKFTLSLSS